VRVGPGLSGRGVGCCVIVRSFCSGQEVVFLVFWVVVMVGVAVGWLLECGLWGVGWLEGDVSGRCGAGCLLMHRGRCTWTFRAVWGDFFWECRACVAS